MDESEYMQERVDRRISWYDAASLCAKRNYQILGTVQVITATLIPAMVALNNLLPEGELLIAFMGCLVALASAVANFNQYHMRWLHYRATCEMLMRQKFLYITHAKPYDGQDRFPLFVETMENIMSNEANEWVDKGQPGTSNSKA